MYDIIHHDPADGGGWSCTAETLEKAIEIAKERLKSFNQSVSETELVATIWRASAVVAVVLDDANGLVAYKLKHIG